jgi:hypothetical protein
MLALLRNGTKLAWCMIILDLAIWAGVTKDEVVVGKARPTGGIPADKQGIATPN